MPKVLITETEWYPVYREDEDYGREIEMTDEELATYRKVAEAFDNWQDILENRYIAAAGRSK